MIKYGKREPDTEAVRHERDRRNLVRMLGLVFNEELASRCWVSPYPVRLRYRVSFRILITQDRYSREKWRLATRLIERYFGKNNIEMINLARHYSGSRMAVRIILVNAYNSNMRTSSFGVQ